MVDKEKFLVLCFLSFGPEFLYTAIQGSGLTFVSLWKRDGSFHKCRESGDISLLDRKQLFSPYSHPKFAAISELKENTSRSSG